MGNIIRQDGINPDVKYLKEKKIPVSFFSSMYKKYDQVKEISRDMFKFGLMYIEFGILNSVYYQNSPFDNFIFSLENNIGYNVVYYYIEREDPFLIWSEKMINDSEKEIRKVLKTKYKCLEGY